MMRVNFIIVFINIIKVLPSSSPVSPISLPIIEILPQNFQDKFRFPKNALFFILTLIINIIIIIIIIIIVFFIIIIKVLPSATPVTPIFRPIIMILPRNFQDKSRFPKNALFLILTLIINIIIIIIIIIIIFFIIIIKVLPSATPVTHISQPIIEILTRNFQDAFRFPKNTLSLILALNINNNIIIIIIIMVIFIKLLPSFTPVSPISQ